MIGQFGRSRLVNWVEGDWPIQFVGIHSIPSIGQFDRRRPVIGQFDRRRPVIGQFL